MLKVIRNEKLFMDGKMQAQTTVNISLSFRIEVACTGAVVISIKHLTRIKRKTSIVMYILYQKGISHQL